MAGCGPVISPVALEAVKRIDVLFDIARTINGLSIGERLRVRRRPPGEHPRGARAAWWF
jgi:hypothetical protein